MCRLGSCTDSMMYVALCDGSSWTLFFLKSHLFAEQKTFFFQRYTAAVCNGRTTLVQCINPLRIKSRVHVTFYCGVPVLFISLGAIPLCCNENINVTLTTDKPLVKGLLDWLLMLSVGYLDFVITITLYFLSLVRLELHHSFCICCNIHSVPQFESHENWQFAVKHLLFSYFLWDQGELEMWY